MNKCEKPSCLLGLAIGDALGQPFEFSTAEFIANFNWDGEFVNRNVERKRNPGDYTDDTLMALALTNSLIENGGYDVNCAAKHYLAWFESGDWRGIGQQTEKAMIHLKNGMSPLESGIKNIGKAKPTFKRLSNKTTDGDFCGNGAVMRIAPLAVYYKDNKDLAFKYAKQDANITHNHPDARDANIALVDMIIRMLNGAKAIEAFLEVAQADYYEYDHVPKQFEMALKLMIDGPNSFDLNAAMSLGVRGTAHETLASAIYCLLTGETYRECVVNSVLLSGDCDSRGAICGAMAGIKFGLGGLTNEYYTNFGAIPKSYSDNVENTKMLQELDIKLLEGPK